MWRRIMFAFALTIADAIAAVIYYRIGVGELFPIANNHQGPFSPLIGQLKAIVPLVLMLLLVFAWGYVVWGAVQRERSVRARGVR